MELAVAERYSVFCSRKIPQEEDTCSSQGALPVYFQRDLKAPAVRQCHL